MKTHIAIPCLAAAALAGCSTVSDRPASASPMSSFSQSGLPAAVQVPSGHKVAMETVGTGEITYQCREKQGAAGAYEWVFVAPKAGLNDRAGTRVGSYYGPPATWESMDGSRITGTQVAVAPAGSGSIPLQLVKANPAMGEGTMTGVSYIQRVATRGGVAPAAACSAATAGRNEVVKYQADYIFWTGR